MDEPIDRRSNRSRKPKIHLDEIVQSSSSSKPSNAPKKPLTVPKKPLKTSEASTKPPPTTKSSKAPSETLLNPPILELVEELCSQIAGLDIKAKKKAKSDEISRLKNLRFHSILKEIKPLKEIEYKPFTLGNHCAPKVNILSNINTTNPLALLDLFIYLLMYITIAENTNLYATFKEALIASTKSST